MQRAAHQQAFQGDLHAGHVRLGEQELGGIPGGGHVLAGEQGSDAAEGRHELVHVVGADDAAAGRERQRLQHAGKLHATRGEERVVLERDAAIARDRHAGRGQALAHLVLVARGRHRGAAAGPQPQALGDGSGGDRGQIVDAHHCRQRPAVGQRRDARGGGVGVVEVERQQVVGRVGLEGAGLVRGADDLDAERAGGLEKVVRAVRRRRQEQ